jgi:hypothetical protein
MDPKVRKYLNKLKYGNGDRNIYIKKLEYYLLHGGELFNTSLSNMVQSLNSIPETTNVYEINSEKEWKYDDNDDNNIINIINIKDINNFISFINKQIKFIYMQNTNIVLKNFDTLEKIYNQFKENKEKQISEYKKTSEYKNVKNYFNCLYDGETGEIDGDLCVKVKNLYNNNDNKFIKKVLNAYEKYINIKNNIPEENKKEDKEKFENIPKEIKEKFENIPKEIKEKFDMFEIIFCWGFDCKF